MRHIGRENTGVARQRSGREVEGAGEAAEGVSQRSQNSDDHARFNEARVGRSLPDPAQIRSCDSKARVDVYENAFHRATLSRNDSDPAWLSFRPDAERITTKLDKLDDCFVQHELS